MKLPYIRPIYFVVAPLGFQFSISRRMTTNRYTTTTTTTTACKKHQRNNPVHARKKSETKKTKAKLYGRMLNATSSTSAQINKMVMWRRAIRCICVIFFTQSKTKRKKLAANAEARITYFFLHFFFHWIGIRIRTLFFCFYFLAQLRFLSARVLFKTWSHKKISCTAAQNPNNILKHCDFCFYFVHWKRKVVQKWY